MIGLGMKYRYKYLQPYVLLSIRHYSHKLILEYKNTIEDTSLQVKLNGSPDGCDR